jgi:hypothetical protein
MLILVFYVLFRLYSIRCNERGANDDIDTIFYNEIELLFHKLKILWRIEKVGVGVLH